MHWSLSLFDFYLKNRVVGRRIPLLASFKLTYRCNLQCAPCPFHLRSGSEDSHMGWTTALDCLEALRRRGCRFVVFEGGEPLIWKSEGHDFADLAKHAGNLFLRTAVTTNGTLPLDVPVDIVWVSLDGARETHNRLRYNSFDTILENMKLAERKQVFVHFTMNRENHAELAPLLDILAEIPAFRGLTVQLFYPYQDGETDLALRGDRRREAIESVLSLKRAGRPILNSESRLRSMIHNDWTCREWLLMNVDPNGAITQGCYVKSRGTVRCEDCGFTPVAEAVGAYDLLPGSILAGWNLFLRR